MNNELYLGIDTSCYTTSVAAAWGDKIVSLKKPLEVKVGDCGLRQSEAFFQHSKNLPVLFEELKGKVDFAGFDKITVTVSTRPRNVEGSYMPVFLAGAGYARAISAVLGADLLETSHQEGHIMAALHSCGDYSIAEKPFLTYHISGGTTELLLVKKNGNGFRCDIVGGTRDLAAGQFIDRIGVLAGFSFPAGKYVDEAALKYDGEPKKVRISVSEEYINFSGAETSIRRSFEKDSDGILAAHSTMEHISRAIRKSLESAMEKYDVKNVLMVGGVSSSKFLRKEFLGISGVFFAESDLSTDNAVGTCLIGKR